MAQAPMSNNIDQPSDTKSLSIEIEPSYPLIIAITEFFRAHKKPHQSLELCQRGLNYFPGDLGLRIGLAMAYFELSEKEKAWSEINYVVQELTQMAPMAESIAQYFHSHEQNRLSDWFHRLFQVLVSTPEEAPENKANALNPSLISGEQSQLKAESKIEKNSFPESFETKTSSQSSDQEISRFPSEKTRTEVNNPSEEPPDSNILSTLTGWLSQLKESKA